MPLYGAVKMASILFNLYGTVQLCLCRSWIKGRWLETRWMGINRLMVWCDSRPGPLPPFLLAFV